MTDAIDPAVLAEWERLKAHLEEASSLYRIVLINHAEEEQLLKENVDCSSDALLVFEREHPEVCGVEG